MCLVEASERLEVHGILSLPSVKQAYSPNHFPKGIYFLLKYPAKINLSTKEAGCSGFLFGGPIVNTHVYVTPLEESRIEIIMSVSTVTKPLDVQPNMAQWYRARLRCLDPCIEPALLCLGMRHVQLRSGAKSDTNNGED